ncbi:hypothetical protein LXL04_007396 [Taraxacum kok-saghyz]
MVTVLKMLVMNFAISGNGLQKSIRYEQSGEAQSLYRNLVKVTGTSGGRCASMVVLTNGVDIGGHNGGADNHNGGADNHNGGDDNHNGGWDEGRIATLVGQEIARAFREELPPMLDAFRCNMLGTTDARIIAAIAAAMNADRGRGQGAGPHTRLWDFTSMSPPS